MKNKMKTKQCKDFEASMVDALYRQLGERDNEVFQAHLKVCSACAREYEEMGAVLGVMDRRQRPGMDDAFWDNYLPRLQEKIKSAGHSPGYFQQAAAWLKQWRRRFHFDMRWIMVPAAAMLLVAVGIAIGRFIYLPAGPSPRLGHQLADSSAAARRIDPVVSRHFDNLRPVLIDCANYSGDRTAGTGERVWVDRNMLQKLMLENRLLKQMAARSSDASLKQLLEELELILLEISNPGTGADRERAMRAVQTILNQNDTLFKMRVFGSGKDKKPVSL
jgi:hypothetical protein